MSTTCVGRSAQRNQDVVLRGLTIIVEAVTAVDAAAPSVRLEVTTPDGSTRTVVTDAHGRAVIDGIDPGSCKILVPRIDQSDWSAGGAAAELVRKDPGRPHVVRAGECLSQLTHANGFADWHRVWDHAENESLKAKRKSLHVLLPGDRLLSPASTSPRSCV